MGCVGLGPGYGAILPGVKIVSLQSGDGMNLSSTTCSDGHPLQRLGPQVERDTNVKACEPVLGEPGMTKELMSRTSI